MEYQDNATPTGVVSGGFGTEVIALAATTFKGQGANQPCREVQIWVEEGKDIRIGESVTAAASGPLLPDGVTNHPIVLPISNTNLLYFKGDAQDDVYLLWRT